MSDDLTPLQSLALGICAARWRLGEPCWTFERQPSITQAWITDAGKARMVCDDYQPPNGDDAPTPLLYQVGRLYLTRVGKVDRWRIQDLAENGAATSYLAADGTWAPMDSGPEWQERHWHTWDRAVQLAKEHGK